MNNQFGLAQFDRSLRFAVALATAVAALLQGSLFPGLASADPGAQVPRQRGVSLEHLQDKPIRVCVEAPPEMQQAVKGTVLNVLNDEFTIAKKRSEGEYPVVRVAVRVYPMPNNSLWIVVVHTELREKADIQRLKDCNRNPTRLVKTWSFGHVDTAAPNEVMFKVGCLVNEQTNRLLEAVRGHQR